MLINRSQIWYRNACMRDLLRAGSPRAHLICFSLADSLVFCHTCELGHPATTSKKPDPKVLHIHFFLYLTSLRMNRRSGKLTALRDLIIKNESPPRHRLTLKSALLWSSSSKLRAVRWARNFEEDKEDFSQDKGEKKTGWFSLNRCVKVSRPARPYRGSC